MSTLHTVNKSPFATRTLESCLNHCKDGDAILMIEDGVYGGLSGTEVAGKLAKRTGTVSVYVLSPDVDARGIAADRLMEGVARVGYDDFVDLVADHDRTQAWL